MKYEELGDRRYVYGDAASLAYYHAQVSGSVADSELGKKFLQTFIEKKAHI